eukprot:scaffold103741_cov93-Phaeocystis_antarctica.AAC.1
MEQLRVEPNAHSYCAAIAAHEHSARWRDALGLLAAMKARLLVVVVVIVVVVVARPARCDEGARL